MRFYKHRVTPNATSIARTFNEQFKPEIIPEHNDPYRVDWLDSCQENVLIGEKVSILLVNFSNLALKLVNLPGTSSR
jgi:hypothetical protein